MKRRCMQKKGFLQMSFAWLFAIIVGAFILFLAIYAATKLIETDTTVSDVKTSKEIGVLLNPLEIGIETGKSSSMTFPTDSRIYSVCEEEEPFGKQKIKVSQKVLNKWSDTKLEVSFLNKYIFAEEGAEGKEFYIFSKPFEFPFKVSDLIYLTSSRKNYCFSSPPEDIEEEISGLKQKNLFTADCPDGSVKICFGGSGCDISVTYDEETRKGNVKKEGKTLYFESDALMYAAIFSDSDDYECQLKRLMQRTKSLALLYQDKAVLVQKVGCTSRLDLSRLGNNAEGLRSSIDIGSVGAIARDIKDKNEFAECRLW